MKRIGAKPMIILSLLLGLVFWSEAPAQILWSAHFQNAMEGAYDEARAKVDFGPFIQYVNIPAGRAQIKMDPESGSRVLEVKYPKDCVGPDACAMQVRSAFAAKDSAWMRYRVRFESGFDWKKGGKLPGLCGGKCNTGCINVTGEDGWSARMMWQPGGKVTQYMYYPDKQNGCGADLPWSAPVLTTGRWYEIINQVVLNTPVAPGGTGKHDGIMRAWLDGKLVLERTNIRFRDIASVKLDAFYFSTFHGGDDGSWGPDQDSYASFKDLTVTASDPRITTALLKQRKHQNLSLPLRHGLLLKINSKGPGQPRLIRLNGTELEPMEH
jgi:hypothetical protein